MFRNLINEILSKTSFSNLKTILFGIFLSLLVMQCSKSTDPVTTTPASGCPSGQSKNESGSCAVDATLCQNGQGKANACTTCDIGYVPNGGVCIVPVKLDLSVNTIKMYAQIGFNASFTIDTDSNWTITAPEWLSVSPASGFPGTAIPVNLTTITLNTIASITGSLSVKATGRPELDKTLNLTRSQYAFCGGTIGLVGPSIVVSKWVSMGAAEHNTYSPKDPNGRFLVAVAKGCGGGNNTNENNMRKANDIFLNLYFQSLVTSTKSNTLSFAESPFIGAFIDGRYVEDLSVSPSLEINNDNNLRVNFQFYPLVEGEPGTLFSCNSKNQYSVSNLANLSNNRTPKQTCLDVTTSSFPPVLKDTMNTLLLGANKSYSIP